MPLGFRYVGVLAICAFALSAATNLAAEVEGLMQPSPGMAQLADSLQWEKRILAFETADGETHLPAPTGGILFVGSSSIERWQTLSSDFRGLPVVGRGFSGTTLAETVHYVKRVVVPCRPRIIVVYSGSNDIAVGMKPTTVLENWKRFVAEVRAELPAARMLYISNAPNPARWSFIEQIREANALIADYCRATGEAEFVDVFSSMLSAEGAPRAELFVEDRLHMNASGYALWTKLLEPLLRGERGSRLLAGSSSADQGALSAK